MAKYNIPNIVTMARRPWGIVKISFCEKSRIVFLVRFHGAISVALRVRPSFVPRLRIIVRNGYNNIQQYVVINGPGLMMGHLTHGMPIVTVGGRLWERLVAGTRSQHVESPKTRREDFGRRGSRLWLMHYNNILIL